MAFNGADMKKRGGAGWQDDRVGGNRERKVKDKHEEMQAYVLYS